jgi:diguanylate cyclase (GGDEF)-like protein
MGGWLFATNLTSYRALVGTTEEFARFNAAILAANAISSERGPSNSAMGATPETQSELMEKLAEKRASTDAVVAELWTKFANELENSPLMKLHMSNLQLELSRGRDAIDTVIKTPTEQRKSDMVSRSIEAMFRAADAAMTLRNALAQSTIMRQPEVTTEVLMASTANDLREYEGRVGSYVVMMLTSNNDHAHLHSLEHVEARLTQMHATLIYFAAPYFATTEVQQQLRTVSDDFFNKGLNLAKETGRRFGPGNAMTAADFTAQYVPLMASSEKLREIISEASFDRITARRDAALRAVVYSTVLSLIGLMVITGIALVFRTRLFKPLMSLHHQIMQVAQGDYTEPGKMARTSPEANQMYAGLTVLRSELRHKAELEEAQIELAKQLKQLSETDPLTGLPNRRAVSAKADELIKICDAAGEGLGIVMLDVDHFKQINDTYGHEVGDIVLQEIAAALPREVRTSDVFARQGGEEFLMLLGHVDQTTCLIVAEKLRAALERMEIAQYPHIRVTGSFGVAVRPPGSALSFQELVTAADHQLYRAKRLGRNRVCSASQGRTQMRDKAKSIAAII